MTFLDTQYNFDTRSSKLTVGTRSHAFKCIITGLKINGAVQTINGYCSKEYLITITFIIQISIHKINIANAYKGYNLKTENEYCNSRAQIQMFDFLFSFGLM